MVEHNTTNNNNNNMNTSNNTLKTLVLQDRSSFNASRNDYRQGGIYAENKGQKAKIGMVNTNMTIDQSIFTEEQHSPGKRPTYQG